jgi:hypothetical protein
MCCLRLAGRLWKARNPRALTFITRESPALFFDEPEPHGVGHSLGPMAFMPSMAREELGGFFRMSPFAGKTVPRIVF